MQLDEQGILRVPEWVERFPWLIHGFSTRKTGDFVGDQDPTNVFGCPSAVEASPKQVHSATVVVAEQPWSGPRPEADAVVAKDTRLLVGVRTADCVPILMVDPIRRAVAATHAGWRGAVAGITANTIQTMQREFGCEPKDMAAAIGPAIGVCCFEVGEEVAAEFATEFLEPRTPRPHVDLIRAVESQLRDTGVISIIKSAMCTKCTPDQLFSYRRDGAAAGRMIACIGIRS